MGSLMTPTTELFYAFVNLEDTPVPRDVPEEDVFARAFRQATVAQPHDFNLFGEQLSAGHSPQDLIFDDFLCKDDDGQGDTSPSSVSSSSTKPLFQTPEYTADTPRQLQRRNDQQNATRSVPAEQILYEAPQQIIDANQNGAFAPSQQFSAPAPIEASYPPPTHFPEQQKQPRRRNTKRKVRTEEEEALRRTAFLERNRQAAQKCRSRKKRQTNTLEDDLAIQEEINARLKAQADELLAELRNLKEVYMQCEQECQHAKVRVEPENTVEGEVTEKGDEKREEGIKNGPAEGPETDISSEPPKEVVETMDLS